MRDELTRAFELRIGGEVTMLDWCWQQRADGRSLIEIARDVSHLAGIFVTSDELRARMQGS